MVRTLTHQGRMVDLTAVVRDEYRDMPGMCLTMAQAARLWNVEHAPCRDALAQLIAEGFLRQVGEVYVRASNPRYQPEEPVPPSPEEFRAGDKASFA